MVKVTFSKRGEKDIINRKGLRGGYVIQGDRRKLLNTLRSLWLILNGD